MTTLHDQLADAVGDVHADLPALTLAARRRGLAQRRRRRALAVVGTAAAALLVGSTAVLLTSGGSEPAPIAVDPTPSASASASVAPVATVPLDGRGTAGLVAQAIAAYGLEATSSSGQGAPGDETYAAVTLAGGVQVGVNVQHADRFEFPDGLTTHREDDGKVGTDRWVATYVDHARNLRVSVAVIVPEGTAPPLSEQQLAALAQDPVWAFEVSPAAAAAAPAPYTPLDTTIDGASPAG